MSDAATGLTPLGLSTDLSGQIALITGASQGLGKACAIRLAGCGATALCVARSIDKLAQVVAEIEAAGGKAEAIACDHGNRWRAPLTF
ncbi:MAG: SDR family NAD(P)-dependent oxidoreductase, partial [Aureliella sp.]